jgi:hypothetical protein
VQEQRRIPSEVQSEWHSENFAATSPAPTELQMLAEELGVDEDAFREYLRSAIQARLREKGEAWKQLDETIAERERRRSRAVKAPGQGGRTKAPTSPTFVRRPSSAAADSQADPQAAKALPELS